MFRVTIRGKFDGLDETGRAAVQAATDTAFTEAGTFTHDGTFSAFTFRCQVPEQSEDDDEKSATGRALAALAGHGLPHQVLRVAVTDMRHIKIRRKGRKQAG